jgi:hypothetical protein
MDYLPDPLNPQHFLHVSRTYAYLATFNWNLIEADKIELADRDKDYGEEFNELLARAEVNPNAIILRRFYTYKPM